MISSRPMVAWVSSIVVLLLLAACGVEIGTGTEPTRPANIPAAATFAGGADGGVFVTVEHREGTTYDIQVYLVAGVLAYKGRATLSKFSRGRTVTAADVSGWDGEVLLLSPDGVLTPTEPLPSVGG